MALSEVGGAESGALGAREPQIAPNLAFLLEAWGQLSTDAQAQIVAIAKQGLLTR